MFCPKCGAPDQSPDSYCRLCGIFLPDIEKQTRRRSTPQDHVRANIALGALTILTSFTLAILLYTILGSSESTHPLIYVTVGLLVAIGSWHVQSLYRMLQLGKQF